MSLRARLVMVVFVVVAAGLLASDFATATALRSYLLGRVDERLSAVATFTARAFGDDTFRELPPRRFPVTAGSVPPRDVEVQAALIGPDNRVLQTLQSPFSSTSDVFAHIPDGPLARARRGETVRFIVTSPSGRARALAQPMVGTSSVVVLVSSLGDVDASLSRLYWIEGIATAVLLVLAGGAAFWLVRVGLRPLSHITDTADAVAAGQVDRRVDVSGGHEVARLGRALNSAFDARAASEQNLREFISDASHELRTPLTSIRGYAELLRAGALSGPEEQERAMARIEHEAARMGVLVDELLALARLDEGRPLQFADVDLAVIAADAVNDTRAVEPERTITLVAPEPARVIGDETCLRQVFANLLSNVGHHTAPGTPVEVRVARTHEGARIDVVDDGEGLRPEDLAHAFDRFWRAGNGVPGHDRGSGLGLAIVAAIVKAHGGRASAELAHEPWRGAHFVVVLPARPPI